MKQKEWQLFQKELNNIPEAIKDESLKHPTPEQLLVREAAKFLTPKQKKVWALYNYDRLTQDEIAEKLGKDQSTIARNIKGIEKRITKWVKSNLGAYNLLKSDLGETDA